MMVVLSIRLLVTEEVVPPTFRVVHLSGRPSAPYLSHLLQKQTWKGKWNLFFLCSWYLFWIKLASHTVAWIQLHQVGSSGIINQSFPNSFDPSSISWPFMLTPLSSRLSNSSLILRSCWPYFLAAHRAGGADLDLPLNGNPSVGVPASSSPLARRSSSLEAVEVMDSEFSLIRPFTI